ncbi:unnamed protein product, partial [marine sediment metagenome]
MVGPSDISEGLSGAFSGLLGSTMIYLGYFIVILIICGIFFGIYMYFQYKYKVIIFERGGSGNEDGEDSHFIRKIFKDRAREVQDKTGTTKWQLMLGRKKFEPISLKHIYPGNYVFLYKVAPDCYVPTDFSCSAKETTFNPIPQSIRRWMALEIP